MSTMIRARTMSFFALLTAAVLALSACGGGSSSAGGGGGSGGTVAGTVGDGVAVFDPVSGEQPVMMALAHALVATAHADGIPGVNVELLDAGGGVVATQTTNADGRFMFTGLAPGNYSLRLSQNGAILGQTPSLQVDSNTRTEIELSLDGNVTSVEVEASNDTISGEIERDDDDDRRDDDEDDDDDDDSDDDGDDDDDDSDDDDDDDEDDEDDDEDDD